MSGKRIDLHMHSCYSDDGEFTPEQLVETCVNSGIEVMAIADHNSVRACAPGERAASEAGITYIPAIEIDCTYRGVNLHVLGYGVDYRSRDFADIEQSVTVQARNASGGMLKATRELGFEVTQEEMAVLAGEHVQKDIWTGEMFAEALLNKPEYDSYPLLLPYRPGGLRSDNPYVNFYWDYYSQGKPCYVEIQYPSLDQVIEVIHRNGGYAVLAHPGVNLNGRVELLKPMVETGLDGIEAFSSYHCAEQADYFYHEAKRSGLFFTCGSDYHGKTKPSIQVGGHGCPVPEGEVLEQLKPVLGRISL